MAIMKKDYRAYLPANISVADGIDRSAHWWILSIYYDSTWNKTTARDVQIHHPGSGVRDHYALDHPGVLKAIGNGRVFAVLYYTGGAGTSATSPWIPGWGNWKTTFGQYVLRMAYEVQAGIESLIDNTGLSDSPISVRDIYLTAKSRGGPATVFWSGISRTTNLNKYWSRVKGIVNTNGVSGSAEGTWTVPHDSMYPMFYGMNNAQHPIVHVYNDGDVKGPSDFRRRLQYGLNYKGIQKNYFYNFHNDGHVMNWDFVNAMMTCWAEKKPLEWEGKKLVLG